MSDRRETCAVANLGLEEVFCSREFGRRPARRFARTAAFEPAEPSQLEQVFLSEWFGRPEAIASGRSATTGHVSAASGSPTLVVLQGGRERSAERNGTRVRVLAAVTGVAAAALVVAGLSSGTGRGPAHPTLSALGPSPNQSSSSGQAAGSPPSFVGSAPTAPAASGAAVTPARPADLGRGAVRASSCSSRRDGRRGGARPNGARSHATEHPNELRGWGQHALTGAQCPGERSLHIGVDRHRNVGRRGPGPAVSRRIAGDHDVIDDARHGPGEGTGRFVTVGRACYGRYPFGTGFRWRKEGIDVRRAVD